MVVQNKTLNLLFVKNKSGRQKLVYVSDNRDNALQYAAKYHKIKGETISIQQMPHVAVDIYSEDIEKLQDQNARLENQCKNLIDRYVNFYRVE